MCCNLNYLIHTYLATQQRLDEIKARKAAEELKEKVTHCTIHHEWTIVIQEKAESLQKLLQGRKKKRKKRNEEVEEEESTWLQQNWKVLLIIGVLILCSATALTVYIFS